MNQCNQGIGSTTKKVSKWLRVGKLQFNFRQGKGFFLLTLILPPYLNMYTYSNQRLLILTYSLDITMGNC